MELLRISGITQLELRELEHRLKEDVKEEETHNVHSNHRDAGLTAALVIISAQAFMTLAIIYAKKKSQKASKVKFEKVKEIKTEKGVEREITKLEFEVNETSEEAIKEGVVKELGKAYAVDVSSIFKSEGQ